MNRKRVPGMMSYTSDPSLRKYTAGPIRPMEEERRSWWLVRVLFGKD